MLLRLAVALQLDVKGIAEDALKLHQALAGELLLPMSEGRVDRPLGAAGQRNEALGVAGERRDLDVRRLRVSRPERGLGRELDEMRIAASAGREESNGTGGASEVLAIARPGCVRRRPGVAEIGLHGQAHDRLDSGGRQFLGEFERPEQVARVGQSDSRHPVLLSEARNLPDGKRAFEQRVGRMHLEVHEPGPRQRGLARLGD